MIKFLKYYFQISICIMDSILDFMGVINWTLIKIILRKIRKKATQHTKVRWDKCG